MPQFCTECGAELAPKARFCIACGAPVKAQPAAGTMTPAAEPLKLKTAPPTPTQPPLSDVGSMPVKRGVSRPVLMVVVLLGVITGALGGGYFYLNTYQPELLVNLKTTVTGLFGAYTAATPDTTPATGTGTTTAQIRATSAEQALREGRLKDADAQLKQAEELEPNSPAIQALRAKLNEAKVTEQRADAERALSRYLNQAEKALSEGKIKDAAEYLGQAEALAPRSSAITPIRARLDSIKEQRARNGVEERRAKTTIYSVSDHVRDAAQFEVFSKVYDVEPARLWKTVVATFRDMNLSFDKIDNELWVVVTREHESASGQVRIRERYFVVVRKDGQRARVSIRPFMYLDRAGSYTPISRTYQTTAANLLFTEYESRLAGTH